MKFGKFRLGIWKKFFTVRVVGNWSRFPREVVGAPTQVTFKAKLEKALTSLV